MREAVESETMDALSEVRSNVSAVSSIEGDPSCWTRFRTAMKHRVSNHLVGEVYEAYEEGHEGYEEGHEGYEEGHEGYEEEHEGYGERYGEGYEGYEEWHEGYGESYEEGYEEGHEGSEEGCEEGEVQAKEELDSPGVRCIHRPTRHGLRRLFMRKIGKGSGGFVHKRDGKQEYVEEDYLNEEESLEHDINGGIDTAIHETSGARTSGLQMNSRDSHNVSTLYPLLVPHERTKAIDTETRKPILPLTANSSARSKEEIVRKTALQDQPRDQFRFQCDISDVQEDWQREQTHLQYAANGPYPLAYEDKVAAMLGIEGKAKVSDQMYDYARRVVDRGHEWCVQLQAGGNQEAYSERQERQKPLKMSRQKVSRKTQRRAHASCLQCEGASNKTVKEHQDLEGKLQSPEVKWHEQYREPLPQTLWQIRQYPQYPQYPPYPQYPQYRKHTYNPSYPQHSQYQQYVQRQQDLQYLQHAQYALYGEYPGCAQYRQFSERPSYRQYPQYPDHSSSTSDQSNIGYYISDLGDAYESDINVPGHYSSSNNNYPVAYYRGNAYLSPNYSTGRMMPTLAQNTYAQPRAEMMDMNWIPVYTLSDDTRLLPPPTSSVLYPSKNARTTRTYNVSNTEDHYTRLIAGNTSSKSNTQKQSKKKKKKLFDLSGAFETIGKNYSQNEKGGKSNRIDIINDREHSMNEMYTVTRAFDPSEVSSSYQYKPTLYGNPFQQNAPNRKSKPSKANFKCAVKPLQKARYRSEISRAVGAAMRPRRETDKKEGHNSSVPYHKSNKTKKQKFKKHMQESFETPSTSSVVMCTTSASQTVQETVSGLATDVTVLEGEQTEEYVIDSQGLEKNASDTGTQLSVGDHEYYKNDADSSYTNTHSIINSSWGINVIEDESSIDFYAGNADISRRGDHSKDISLKHASHFSSPGVMRLNDKGSETDISNMFIESNKCTSINGKMKHTESPDWIDLLYDVEALDAESIKRNINPSDDKDEEVVIPIPADPVSIDASLKHVYLVDVDDRRTDTSVRGNPTVDAYNDEKQQRMSKRSMSTSSGDRNFITVDCELHSRIVTIEHMKPVATVKYGLPRGLVRDDTTTYTGPTKSEYDFSNASVHSTEISRIHHSSSSNDNFATKDTKDQRKLENEFVNDTLCTSMAPTAYTVSSSDIDSVSTICDKSSDKPRSFASVLMSAPATLKMDSKDKKNKGDTSTISSNTRITKHSRQRGSRLSHTIHSNFDGTNSSTSKKVQPIVEKSSKDSEDIRNIKQDSKEHVVPQAVLEDAIQTSDEKMLLETHSVSHLDALLLMADKLSLLNLNEVTLKPTVVEWITAVQHVYANAELLDVTLSSWKVQDEVVAYTRRGFLNSSNFCYLNAVFQALLPISAFWQIVMHPNVSSQSVRPAWRSLKALGKEIFGMDERASHGIIPHLNVAAVLKDLISAWERGHAAPGLQHDAQEFLLYTLNSLMDECKWQRRNESESHVGVDSFVEVGRKNKMIRQSTHGFQDDSPISRIFSGILRTIYNDNRRNKLSQAFEPFFMLDVALKSTDKTMVQAIRRTFTAADVNSQLSSERVKSQTCLLEKAPMVLMIALKRYYYDKTKKSVRKHTNAISIDEELTIESKWCSSSCDDAYTTYNLVSVVCHKGSSANSGHYIAYVNPDRKQWYAVDDTVWQKHHFQDIRNSADCYLFFYVNKKRSVSLLP